jgi:hypothetical protein
MQRKTVFDPSPFLNITSPSVAYFLGMFWADGNIFGKNNQNRMSLEILTSDYKQIEQCVLSTGRWRIYDRRQGRTKFVNANNRTLFEYLKDHNYHTKSHKGFPTILDKIPDKLKHYWYRGYFDGDGTVIFNPSAYRKCMKIAGPHDNNWSFLTDLCGQLDIHDYKIRKETKKLLSGNVGRNSCFIFENYDNIFKFGEYIYQDYDQVGLFRKYDKYMQIKQYCFN